MTDENPNYAIYTGNGEEQRCHGILTQFSEFQVQEIIEEMGGARTTIIVPNPDTPEARFKLSNPLYRKDIWHQEVSDNTAREIKKELGL